MRDTLPFRGVLMAWTRKFATSRFCAIRASRCPVAPTMRILPLVCAPEASSVTVSPGAQRAPFRARPVLGYYAGTHPSRVIVPSRPAIREEWFAERGGLIVANELGFARDQHARGRQVANVVSASAIQPRPATKPLDPEWRVHE